MKKTLKPLLFIAILCFYACTNQKQKEQEKEAPLLEKSPSIEHLRDENNRYLMPIMGYRYEVKGDFDGDGRQDTLVEKFISRKTGKETHKFYEWALAPYELTDSLAKYDPIGFAVPKSGDIDTLFISSGRQQRGAKFIKNEGDLTGDGRDEISVFTAVLQSSSYEYGDIMTYKKGKWISLLHFEVQYAVPDFPALGRRLETEENMSPEEVEKEIQRQIDEHKGLAKKIRNNVVDIECVRYDNGEYMGMDTVRFRLDKRKNWKVQSRIKL